MGRRIQYDIKSELRRVLDWTLAEMVRLRKESPGWHVGEYFSASDIEQRLRSAAAEILQDAPYGSYGRDGGWRSRVRIHLGNEARWGEDLLSVVRRYLASVVKKVADYDETLTPVQNEPTCCETGACEGPKPKPSEPTSAGATANNDSTPLATLLKRSIAQVTGATPPHLIVEARAGTGKTTTLVEGLKRVKGIESNLIPSPQQAAVWESMALSKNAKTICFVAFNKSIATELQQRVPAGCDAMTMHSMGLKAVTKALGRLEVNSFVVQDLISEIVGMDVREIRRSKPVVLNATEQLVSLCKMNLVSANADLGDGCVPFVSWEEQLSKLASHYDVDLNGQRNEVFDLVPKVLERCRNPRGKIGFDDMIWLPVVLNLPVFRYDLLLVDEAQDLNRCQQALAKMAGRRLILCGDPKQAIYGFAGADSQSMSRMERELGTDCPRCGVSGNPANTICDCGEKLDWTKGTGCNKLPLTVTRRCGKVIVKEANKIVPDFEAFETNCEGKISEAKYPVQERNGQKTELPWEQTYAAQAKDGDMILCRVNAPLVSQCFRFLKRGIKAVIQGRDVAAGLISTVKKSKAEHVPQLVAWLSDWLAQENAKENAKRNPSESRLIMLSDRYDCLLCFTAGCNTVEEVTKKINDVFTDDRNVRGIRLSSVHKAKGLEARRVFILLPKGAGMPHPMTRSPWQVEQEMNLKYVAITRAIEELVWVS